MDVSKESKPLPIVDNWQAFNKREPRLGVFEFPLYSDTTFTGELRGSDWPYNVLNALPHCDTGVVQQALVLRVHLHRVPVLERFSGTDATAYHGGDLPDEVAALLSLCLGTRLKAGSESRRFDPSDDEFGTPVNRERRPAPSVRNGNRALVLPDVAGSKLLEGLGRLSSICEFSPGTVVALMRAARMYQEALWLAESQPALSWLLLVSSLEAAAQSWSHDQGTPTQSFEQSYGSVATLLRNSGGEVLLNEVARQMAPLIGATRKFVGFCTRFMPTTLQSRPSPTFQIEWDSQARVRILKKVYEYRSRALHGGTPFPLPMCEAPYRDDSTKEYAERGTVALGVITQAATWSADDLPISMHTFHRLTRHALLAWWDSLV